MVKAHTAIDFYNREYGGELYAPTTKAKDHPFYATLEAFIGGWGLAKKRCLEIGCGRGAFQDVVQDYTGVDVAESVRPFLRKPFFQSSATSLPFSNNTFDVAWSYTVLEHIATPEAALSEMRRVLKPGGLLLLFPAWQCRSWNAQGYPVRPYSDFNFYGKLIKVSVPIRDSVLFRSLYIFPRRVLRLTSFLCSRPTRFRFKRLEPNYSQYWMSDSDAVCSMDPYEAILWFTSRKDACLNYPTPAEQFFVRTGHLIFKIQKP
jgi:SAM-dependent methyltransferase